MIRRPLRILLLAILPAVINDRLYAQPTAGSQLPLEQNKCAQCHGEAELWRGEQTRLFISPDQLAEDIHWQKGVACHDCHGGDPGSDQFAATHRREKGFRATAAEIQESCARCHRQQMIDVTRKSVHAKGGEENERGQRAALECAACHGKVQHQLLPAQDPRSPVFLENQVQTCGSCHEKELETYRGSVHGRKGLVQTASCTSCHGNHGIYRMADKRSTLHASHVSETCGQCHRDIDSQLQASVHALDNVPVHAGNDTNSRRAMERQPTCTACHQRHEPVIPRSLSFALQQQLPTGCGNCHSELAGRHDVRLHGELTADGYVPAARCAECHGAHDVLPLSNPQSRLAGAHRLDTCRECHDNAVANFANFDPHANHKDTEKYAGLHTTFARLEMVIFAFVIFFGLHSFFWILRSLVHVLRHGRHKRLASDQRAIVRFSPMHRVFHSVVFLSLMGLAITGLTLKYSDLTWTQTAAASVGGFRSILIVHYLFATLTICYCVGYVVYVGHLIWLLKKVAKVGNQQIRWGALLLGPDSPVPNRRDTRDVLGMIRWFFGLGGKPVFERWTYWEKFDYWAIVAILVFIGTSGLVLWSPNFFARFLSGESLNTAKMIHSEISLLAVGFLLAIHYFNTHFRPEKFPMDLSVLTGLVSEEHLEYARPQYLERMQREGKLDQLRVTLPSRGRLWAFSASGCLVHVVGLVLLLGIIVAALGG